MSERNSFVNQTANDLVFDFEYQHHAPLVYLIKARLADDMDDDNPLPDLLPELERYSANSSALFDLVRDLPGGWVASNLSRILFLRRSILRMIKDDVDPEEYAKAMIQYSKEQGEFQEIEEYENQKRRFLSCNRNEYGACPSGCKIPPRYKKDFDHFGPRSSSISVYGGKKSKKSTKSTKSKKY